MKTLITTFILTIAFLGANAQLKKATIPMKAYDNNQKARLMPMPKQQHFNKAVKYNTPMLKKLKGTKSTMAVDTIFYEDFDGTAGAKWEAYRNSGDISAWPSDKYDPDSLPTGWIVNDKKGKDYYWGWYDAKPDGYWNGYWDGNAWVYNHDTLKSTSYKNGFLILNSNKYNTTDQDGGPPFDEPDEAGYLQRDDEMDSYIETPWINITKDKNDGDLKQNNSMILNFEQSFRYCCSANDKLSVYIKSDSTMINEEAIDGWLEIYNVSYAQRLMDRNIISWGQPVPLKEVEPNAATPNPDKMFVNIYPYTEGCDSVKIRFHQSEASGYYWMIDDIMLTTAEDNDLAIQETGASSNFGQNSGGYLVFPFNHQVPKNQINDDYNFSFVSWIANYGDKTQHDVKLKVTVTDTIENIVVAGLESEVLDSIPASYTAMLSIDDSWVPDTSKIADYKIVFDIVSNEVTAGEDAIPFDNSYTQYFAVTDQTFANEFGYLTHYNSASAEWSEGAYKGDKLANVFAITDSIGTRPTTVRVIMSNNTTPGVLIKASLRKFEASMPWDDYSEAMSPNNLVTERETNEYEYTSADYDFAQDYGYADVYLTFTDTSSCYEEGIYAVVVEFNCKTGDFYNPNDAPNGEHEWGVKRDMKTNTPWWYSWMYNKGASGSFGWGSNPESAMIRLTAKKGDCISAINDIDKQSDKLMQNYPNPFSEQTEILFSTQSKNSELIIRDLTGKTIKVYNFDRRGSHTVRITSDEIGKGIYYYTLKTDNNTQTKKMILVK